MLRGLTCVLMALFLLVNSEVDEAHEKLKVCLYKSLIRKQCFTADSMETLGKNLTDKKYLVVDISNNSIPIIRKGFLVPIMNIEKMWMINCNISVLEPGSFENLTLRDVSFSNNNITRIEYGVFSGNLYMNSLYLRNNLIEFIHKDAFVDMPYLQQINLSRNRLKYWDPNWFSRNWLAFIHISDNLIEELPASSFVFPNVPPLVLNFNNNKIKTLSKDVFKGAVAVNSLILASNQLTEFREDWLEEPYVYVLDIRYNKIRCLPQNLTNVIKASFCTLLRDNPLTCSCIDRISSFARKNKKCHDAHLQDTCEKDPDIF